MQPTLTATETTPLARFVRIAGEAPMPRRADRAAGGTLPTRAFRYCEAATSAAALGWLVFPPIDLDLLWDGERVLWTWRGAGGWHPLSVAQAPGFRDRFDAAAPPALRGWSPPLLGALPEPGLVNLWSGLLAQSRPGWSLLVRAPANLPRIPGIELFEGLVEADAWFGPLFVNLRLTRTGVPICLRTDTPFLMVQPVPRAAHDDAALNGFAAEDGLAALTAEDWAAYDRAIVAPRRNGPCPLGRHAAEQRRRRRAA